MLPIRKFPAQIEDHARILQTGKPKKEGNAIAPKPYSDTRIRHEKTESKLLVN
jgi:hypothetical protein